MKKMVVLKIFNVDKNENEKPLCTLEVGEHVVGRGSFTNCVDKRISRRHVVMNVRDKEATLTLVHITPIFFKSSSTSNIQMLKKDESILLSDGDQFAFLIDTWYTVKIVDNENKSQNLAESRTSTILISNPISSNTIDPSTSNTKVSQSASLKRSADDLYSEERKRLKLVNESLDKLKDNIDQIVAQDYRDDNGDEKQTNEQVGINNTTEVFRREDISESDDDDSDVEMLPEVTQDTEVMKGVQNNSKESSDSGNEGDVDDVNQNSEILDEIKKEPMIENDEQPDIKIEPREIKEEPLIDEGNTSKEIGESNQVGEISDSHNNDDETAEETPVTNQNDTGTTQNPTDASSSSGASMVNTLRREQCWYGQNCYRKNPSHKDQFSHPGDSDYSENSDDNRPECPYGGSCYRSNPQHRNDYKHPRSRPAPKPSTSNRRNRRTNLDANPNTDYDSDSEEEGDPFSADESSSASEVFEGGDSDSDYMGESNFDDMEDNEEVKTMFKEAKKFLRRKRKD